MADPTIFQGGGLSKRRKSFAGEKEGNGKDGKEQKEGSKEKEKLGSIKKEKSIDEDGKVSFMVKFWLFFDFWQTVSLVFIKLNFFFFFKK